ncbi:protein spaetzle 5 [Malaya genurostris]|uniref:protein spaetzle 5 n=1 Tax=Malaya genurostris TaxID=325434 RepID=UPI0026F4043D|nr:protein spaetzle 5 [Malaya genurostris]XP_058459090.1 protein spaetzle 5 [Malaya genurostris]XP_058459091.1 protein spaetzle 5 [Malaya genurostris]XP_058459092.1 protein spaetzle 5 [Malaya genurostris]XP_058459093.1 protein spaetzle 5 [Malaya genurostris]
MTSSCSFAAALICVIHLVAASAPPPPPQQKKCGLYGQAPCTFVPAPPGMTPKCASPGRTYCEHNSDYPTYLIQQLVTRFGLQRILANEERIQFNADRQGDEQSRHLHYQHFYGPDMQIGQATNKPTTHEGYTYDLPKQQQQQQQQQQLHYQPNAITARYDQKSPSSLVPQPIFIPKPQHSFNYNTYVRPPVVHKVETTATFSGYFYPRPATQYSPAEWLKRFARDLSDKRVADKLTRLHQHQQQQINPNELIPTPFRLPTELEIKPSPFRAPSFGLLMNETSYRDSLVRSRQKRQSTDGRIQLCQTREMFVTPQAALNTKGNWMYIVNHDDSRQLVKAEICSSTECSNLCNLPNGYNSRCEQKFSQKRLLTLDSDGQSLYVDTYWFPSCCVCTLAENN